MDLLKLHRTGHFSQFAHKIVHTYDYNLYHIPVRLSTSRNAKSFRYLLEAGVSIMAPLIFAPCLDSFYAHYCDNEAARHARIRGVGKNQPLNCLIAAHWTWHNRTGISHASRECQQRPTWLIRLIDLKTFQDSYEIGCYCLSQLLRF